MPTPRKSIAIVDDDARLRQCIQRHLRAAGYRCETFSSGEEFLAVALNLGAACLLADVHMNGMSGLQLALHPTVLELKLPVVIMTGSVDPLVVAPAQEIGAAFVRKPFFGNELLDAIVDTIGPPIIEGDN